ncbi:MAG: hypothetical protein ACTS8R_04005 [Arsenophonus sp. NC-QC1-MAG3]
MRGNKAEETEESIKIKNTNIIRFYQSLRPIQERNIERLCQYRIINHRDLILSIFCSIHAYIKINFKLN